MEEETLLPIRDTAWSTSSRLWVQVYMVRRWVVSVLLMASPSMSPTLTFLNKGEPPCACQSPEHPVPAELHNTLAFPQSCFWWEETQQAPECLQNLFDSGCVQARFPVDLVLVFTKSNSLCLRKNATAGVERRSRPSGVWLPGAEVRGIEISSIPVRGAWVWIGWS